MLPFGRLARVLGRRKPAAVDPVVGSSLFFRVWPNDLDLNRHMNNSRFLALMDLGRYDLTRRIGMLAVAKESGWFPVVASQTIRYRRSLAPFSRFELRTRVGCWDEKSFFMHQTFWQSGELVAEAWVRARFLSKEGSLTTAQVMALIGDVRPSPAMPESVRLWVESGA